MKKINTIEIMENYLTINANVRDSGLLGKAYEVAIRSYISGRPYSKIKSQGKADITFTDENGKRFTCEIKTACGEIEMADRSQYVIYCPVVDAEFLAELQGYVFTREEWQTFINGYTGRGSFTRLDTKKNHLHIQSFYVSDTVRPKASKTIATYIWDRCDEQPTVDEFFAFRF